MNCGMTKAEFVEKKIRMEEEYICKNCSGAGICEHDMTLLDIYARSVIVVRCIIPHILLRQKIPNILDAVDPFQVPTSE